MAILEGGNTLNKNCKDCGINLTPEIAAKKNKTSYRNQCKKCRSKSVSKSFAGNDKRKAYIREYLRRTGKVKKHPCETCGELCEKHYARAFCSDKCRFMAYVEKDGECWMWRGALNRRGYGKFCLQGKSSFIASRASYELFRRPISKGKYICHLCDIPACVNPEHLWVGTHVENMRDMVEKGRQSSKLSVSEVIEIRLLWADGASNASLCEKFDITSGTVSSIVNKRIWKHV